MKRLLVVNVRLFLFLATTALLGMGRAHAQCSILAEAFPSPGSSAFAHRIPNGTCITNAAGTARLRWDNNSSGLLELFDTDGGGRRFWCDGINDPGGCAANAVPGGSLCLQRDGNMVIRVGNTCSTSSPAVWSSGTVGDNICGEELKVSAASQVVIYNNASGCQSGGLNPVWSRGQDPTP